MDLEQIFEFALTFLGRLPALRAVLGFIIVFFLPGFAWTLVFFKQVSILERVVLAFGLSIALVALSVLILHVLLKIKITALNSLLIIIVLMVIPLGWYYVKRLVTGRPSE